MDEMVVGTVTPRTSDLTAVLTEVLQSDTVVYDGSSCKMSGFCKKMSLNIISMHKQ